MPTVDDILAATAPKAATPPAAASTTNGGLLKLLEQPSVMQQLAMLIEGGDKLTTDQTLATVQSLLNPQGKASLTKADFTASMTSLGASKADADSLWSLISPYGLTRVDGNISRNKALSSAVDAVLPTIQSAESDYVGTPEYNAGKAMTSLLLSSDVLNALAEQSSTYAPPTQNQALATLWSLFDGNRTVSINKGDVKHALIASGADPGKTDTLWAHIAPEAATATGAQDFATNSFILQSISANLPIITAVADQARLSAAAGKSNTILDKSAGATGVLASAASGWNDSPVGSGAGYTNYLKLFR